MRAIRNCDEFFKVHNGPKNGGRAVPAPAPQRCPTCGREHWHPAGQLRCVGCELVGRMGR